MVATQVDSHQGCCSALAHPAHGQEAHDQQRQQQQLQQQPISVCPPAPGADVGVPRPSHASPLAEDLHLWADADAQGPLCAPTPAEGMQGPCSGGMPSPCSSVYNPSQPNMLLALPPCFQQQQQQQQQEQQLQQPEAHYHGQPQTHQLPRSHSERHAHHHHVHPHSHPLLPHSQPQHPHSFPEHPHHRPHRQSHQQHLVVHVGPPQTEDSSMTQGSLLGAGAPSRRSSDGSNSRSSGDGSGSDSGSSSTWSGIGSRHSTRRARRRPKDRRQLQHDAQLSYLKEQMEQLMRKKGDGSVQTLVDSTFLPDLEEELEALDDSSQEQHGLQMDMEELASVAAAHREAIQEGSGAEQAPACSGQGTLLEDREKDFCGDNS